MSDVRFEVSRTREDLWKGIAANLLRSPGTLAWYAGGSVVVAIIAIWANRDESYEALLLIGLVAFAAMLAVYTVMMALSVFLAARKTWSLPGALDPVSYTLSSEGLNVSASTGHGLTSWSAWKSAFETRSLIVIRHQFNLIHVIPKRALDAATLEGVRVVLRANLAKTQLEPAASEMPK